MYLESSLPCTCMWFALCAIWLQLPGYQVIHFIVFLQDNRVLLERGVIMASYPQSWNSRFSLIDVLFGKFDIDEDFIVINHIILLAKFYIYRSKLDNTKPSLEVFKAKLKATLNIEFVIAKRNGKLAQHYKKWESFISIFSISIILHFLSYISIDKE